VAENTLGDAQARQDPQARQSEFPWRPGTATGIGSMPGTDPAEAARIVAGELPDFPYLPELPARGPGADLTGRTAALLIDFPVETTPGGWRIAERPGRYMRAARGMLSSDLDALEEVLSGYTGPLKISLCGPWTLAATIELPRKLDPLLADQGAVADLTGSLAEAAAAHAADVARRVPGAELVVQFDEPALAAVAGGEVPNASGLARLPAVDAAIMAERLGTVLSAAGRYTVVHCCASPVPFGIIKAARPDSIAFDLSLLRREDGDSVAELAELGLGILAGAVPAVPSAGLPSQPGPPKPPDTPVQTAQRVLRFWRRLGLAPARAAEQVVITPACGLAGASPRQATDTLAHCREAARMVPELAEENAEEA
jgi:Cobalamin-independent synthase, Catalytic domain